MTIDKTDFGYQKVASVGQGSGIYLCIAAGKEAEVECPPHHDLTVFSNTEEIYIESKDLKIQTKLDSLDSITLTSGSREFVVNVKPVESLATVLVLFQATEKKEKGEPTRPIKVKSPKAAEPEAVKEEKPVQTPGRRRRRDRRSRAAEQQLRLAKEKGLDVASTPPPKVQAGVSGINNRPQYEVRSGLEIG